MLARQDQLSRAKAKQARQPSQISRPKSRPEADPVARPTSVVATKSPTSAVAPKSHKSTPNLIGHNLTHMAPQNLSGPGFYTEFRPCSFMCSINQPNRHLFARNRRFCREKTAGGPPVREHHTCLPGIVVFAGKKPPEAPGREHHTAAVATRTLLLLHQIHVPIPSREGPPSNISEPTCKIPGFGALGWL